MAAKRIFVNNRALASVLILPGNQVMNVEHCGLYFTSAHIEQARQQREAESIAAAWGLLDTYPAASALVQTQLNGLRYRFAADVPAGEQAVEGLQQLNLAGATGKPFIEQVASVLVQAQIFEMVRDHPAWSQQKHWLTDFADAVQVLQQPLTQLAHVDHLWLNLLNLVSGIVLEQEESFHAAVAIFQRVIDQDIHPEGYILKAVQPGEDEKLYYGDGLYRMLLSAQALILTAEAAAHAGHDLWAYEKRGVSAMTPTPYLLYYYYFPDKWRWDDDLVLEATQALYREHGGLWDMAQQRLISRDRKVLLDELRPIYDVWGGGLTSLTHGLAAEPRKRRGWFG